MIFFMGLQLTLPYTISVSHAYDLAMSVLQTYIVGLSIQLTSFTTMMTFSQKGSQENLLTPALHGTASVAELSCTPYRL